MRTRDAILPDAEKIHELISSYSGDGTLLPRNFAEICENVRDFVVLEHRGKIVGCGALHLYGQHLAEEHVMRADGIHRSHDAVERDGRIVENRGARPAGMP